MQKVPGSKLQVPGEHLLSPDFFLLLCLLLLAIFIALMVHHALVGKLRTQGLVDDYVGGRSMGGVAIGLLFFATYSRHLQFRGICRPGPFLRDALAASGSVCPFSPDRLAVDGARIAGVHRLAEFRHHPRFSRSPLWEQQCTCSGSSDHHLPSLL